MLNDVCCVIIEICIISRRINNHVYRYVTRNRILLNFNVLVGKKKSLDFTSELRARQNCLDLLSRPLPLLRNPRLGVWTWTSDLNHQTSIPIKCIFYLYAYIHKFIVINLILFYRMEQSNIRKYTSRYIYMIIIHFTVLSCKYSSKFKPFT